MNKLRLFRLERGLSQFELSEATVPPVPRYAVQLAEQGIRLPTPEQQQALAECLGVAANELFPCPAMKGESK